MKEWVEAGSVSEFDASDRKQFDAGNGRHVAIFRVAGEFFAVDGNCSHEKASLVLGDVSDHEIMCSLHGARFDLRTGKNLSLPAVRPVAGYRVKVENGKVYVEI